ncbi:MAG TPA: cytochrome C oxidase subunit IV family protein [Phycisphaerae bacterium]|nr:cytochrome C oxidase subunit IV family protein [Phycisphaerae bacterium]HOJ72557.1 cytochrome C oxidase subunit IV family protein [Phycisphaerae bacterium]HOM49782.1 cytochrome C oxidase subunit IV family protein [Phycisphaerae bacterium]HON66561.1 cytochrome C oxidase subunit IV family protein [Phycisphaerae bacterium]HOQ85538.1 cytochrome C oxidase subunit IV family protein [Phycisphaerae bacterium]
MDTTVTHNHEASHHDLAHPVPKRVLIGVWAALVVLTIITVLVAGKDFGRFNIWVALGIATLKASLVALYFMHLRYDSPFNAMILIVALSFVALFIIGTITDTAQYQETMETPANWNVAQ